MINLLFLGGAGFIGSNIIRVFNQNDDYKIFVFEPPFANISRLENVQTPITIIRGYLCDSDLLKSIIEDHKIDKVIHLVSTLVPGSSYSDYKREFENVIFPSIRLMELCADKNIKFVYFSSGGTVYGNSTCGRFKETDLLSPISYYGLSKQILENSILFENRRGKLNYLIIRPSNPFGKGQSLYGNQGLIAIALGKILAKEPIEVWGDGSSVRDYIYIDDLVDSFCKLLNKNINNEIINIGSGFGYSVNDIISKLKNLNIPFDVVYKHSRSIDVNSMILDTTKLEQMIDVKHTHLQDGIKYFFEYVKFSIKR